MNRDSKAIKAGLLKMQQDPMTTRPTARLLMDAIVLMDWLERNLNVAEFALEKLQNASSSEILDSDKGALLSQPVRNHRASRSCRTRVPAGRRAAGS